MSSAYKDWWRKAAAMLAVVGAVVSLGISLWGQVASARVVEPPIYTTTVGRAMIVGSMNREAEEAGVSLGDRILRLDGVPAQHWYRNRGWSQVQLGTAVRYELKKQGGEIYEVVLLPQKRRAGYSWLLIPVLAALFTSGMAYLLIGLFVWRLKHERKEAWAFLLFSCSMAIALFSSISVYDTVFGYERMMISWPLVGATMVHLFTTFPKEPPWIKRRKFIRYVLYGAVVAYALLVLMGRFLGYSTPETSHISISIIIVGVFFSIGILLLERWRSREVASDRFIFNLILAGTLVSFIPVAVVSAAYGFTHVKWPYSLALVWSIAFPVSVGYGIVRGNLFEIDLREVARSSAAYGAATLLITALFASLVAFADTMFGKFEVNASSPYFQGTFLFIAILVFNPLRLRLQNLVDRMFNRDQSSYRDAVREISEAMVSMLSMNEISERLLLAVADAMGVARAMVLLRGEDERHLYPVAWRGDWKIECKNFALTASHPIVRELWIRRHTMTQEDFAEGCSDEVRHQCEEIFQLMDVQLFVPILFGVDLLGIIVVGPKLSGERLGSDDRQLLRTLANQSAIAIENAHAFDEIAKLNETLEARVEARTRELQETQTQLMQSEKMRSLGQLVAGVAHELNNPIGFVHANLQLLEDFVHKLEEAQARGESTERQQEVIRKLLERSREGTERVKGIILNLRAFSRMDQVELSDADLNEEIERTLGLIEPRLRDGIRVETDFGKLPRVRCYPAQLNQVFMNLSMNACDAMQSGGVLRIRTRPSAGGVVIEFADSGPGIPEEIRERIFEPFFTTKPVGQGTGLGLSISQGIVERHGGKLEVECPASGGTCLRVELPLVAKSPAENAGILL